MFGDQVLVLQGVLQGGQLETVFPRVCRAKGQGVCCDLELEQGWERDQVSCGGEMVRCGQEH